MKEWYSGDDKRESNPDLFIKLVILNKIDAIELEAYNVEDYEKYIMNDINNIRRRFGIMERELNETFSLFSAEDFQTEYKMVI